MIRTWSKLIGGALVYAAAASSALAADSGAVLPDRGQFAKPVVLRGVLGDTQIQMRLQPKEDIAEGLKGHYFHFGQSNEILLAGDVEGELLSMEESINGVDVSGEWYGTLNGNVVTGEWQGARGGAVKPFRLEILGTQEPSRRTSSAAKTGRTESTAK